MGGLGDKITLKWLAGNSNGAEIAGMYSICIASEEGREKKWNWWYEWIYYSRNVFQSKKGNIISSLEERIVLIIIFSFHFLFSSYLCILFFPYHPKDMYAVFVVVIWQMAKHIIFFLFHLFYLHSEEFPRSLCIFVFVFMFSSFEAFLGHINKVKGCFI